MRVNCREKRAMTIQGRIFIARHGETVFNAAARMQGNAVDTPLTRTGFAQADRMGSELAVFLGTRQALHLYSSPAGRALQTLAIMAEHIEADWHDTVHDQRLEEINVGSWEKRYYADVIAEQGEIMDRTAGLFSVRPPGGEWYDDIARRLQNWIDETAHIRGDRLVVMHGISSRVLRGLLLGLDPHPLWKAPVADGLPQGSLAMIGNGEEKIIYLARKPE
jgi:broad specificity phosphatase PhoE